MEWNGHNPLAPQPRSRTQRLSPVHIRRQEARRERCIYQFSYPPPAPPAAAGWNGPRSFISSILREPRILFRSHFGRPGRLDSAGQAKSWFSPRNPNLWSRSYLDSPLSLSLRRERGRGDGIGNPPSPISPLLAANVGFSKWEALVERHECLAPKGNVRISLIRSPFPPLSRRGRHEEGGRTSITHGSGARHPYVTLRWKEK